MVHICEHGRSRQSVALLVLAIHPTWLPALLIVCYTVPRWEEV